MLLRIAKTCLFRYRVDELVWSQHTKDITIHVVETKHFLGFSKTYNL